MVSLRRLEMTNILGGSLHVERERGQGPKLVRTLHLSGGGKAHQGDRATGVGGARDPKAALAEENSNLVIVEGVER